MDIPGYTIIRELGRGGMATVYLARQDRLGRQVALKVMGPMAGMGDDFTARFIKEGRIIAQLQHPRIVTIYDLDSVGALHYFSMEYLPNGTLADKIVARMSAAEAVGIIRRIAQALSVAHDHGVIHRDIKPQNILFRADGTPVLTDFGIARAVAADPEATALTTVGMIVGSPRYMSPEQSMCLPIDARADLYSLGCVFHEMLTGDLPYRAADVISLAMQHCSAPLPELPTRVGRFQPIIDRLLAKAPEERFGSTQALLQALDQLERGVPPASGPDDDELTAVATQEMPRAAAVLSTATRTEPETLAPQGTLAEPAPPRPDARSGASRRRTMLAIGVLALIAILSAGYFGLSDRHTADPLSEIARRLPTPPPARSPMIERYETLALEHLRDGELEQSMELIQLALATQPEDIRLHAIEALIQDQLEADRYLRQARASLGQGLIEDSLSSIEQGLKRVPEHQALTILRVQARAAREQVRQAAADSRRQAAEQALAAGQPAEALRLVREGLAAVAGDPALQAVERRVREALETDRNIRDIRSTATSLIAEGLLQDSLALIDKGLELVPDDTSLADLRATVERQIQREQERQAVNLQQQAEIELQQGALEQALATIERALILQPSQAALEDTRARILESQQAFHVKHLLDQAEQALASGRDAQALGFVALALELRPDDAASRALQNRIRARIDERRILEQTQGEIQRLGAQGQFDAALARLDEALLKLPGNRQLEEWRQRLRDEQAAQTRAAALALSARASQLLDMGELQQALALLDQGRKIDADTPELIALGDRIATLQAAADARERATSECMRLNPTQAAPAVKLNAMTAAVDCLLSIPMIAAQPANLSEPLARIRADLNDWVEAQPTEALAMNGFGLIDRLEAAHPNNPELRQIRTRLAAHAGLLPDMIDIAGGCFLIGSPETEDLREEDERQRRICVDDFALAIQETRQRDFSRFVTAADYRTDAERGIGGAEGCLSLDRQAVESPWSYHAWANWRKPNNYQNTLHDHPVACVSANDARAYLRWLTHITGLSYRLPTEAEWEYAARAGTETATYWGDDRAVACAHANVADSGHGWTNSFDCDDGHEWIAPVKTFAPNPWGLHDMLGNVSEWTCSEYRERYEGAETACANAESRDPLVMRGGAWNSGPANLRAAYRNRNYPESRYSFVGFRIARDLPAAFKTQPPGDALAISERSSRR